MAGTVTVNKVFLKEPDRHYVGTEYTIAWTSDASGNATLAINEMAGWLTFAQTVPSGTVAPTINYDVKLKDSGGFDVLEGLLADRSATLTECEPAAGSGIAILRDLNGTYTFDVSNAGDTKAGTCVLRTRYK